MSETTKKKKQRSIFYGGLEGTLDSSGFVVLLVGVLGGIWVLVFADTARMFTPFLIWMMAVATRLVLRALAETIRLQKKALGLRYGGEISEAEATVVYSCSECGAILHTETRCESCGRTIDGVA